MNKEDMDNFLLRYVLDNNPWINEKDIKAYEALNDYDLVIVFKDNSEMIFDTFSNTYKNLERIDYKTNNRDEIIRQQFRSQLSLLMKRRNITEDELAKKINSTQPMVSRYLKGISIPNIVTFKKIGDALECSLDEFFYKYF